jgi:hypothetical protein
LHRGSLGGLALFLGRLACFSVSDTGIASCADRVPSCPSLSRGGTIGFSPGSRRALDLRLFRRCSRIQSIGNTVLKSAHLTVMTS